MLCYTQLLSTIAGYCLIDYAESSATSPDPFSLGPTATATGLNVRYFYFAVANLEL
jgi:hypothetical protein